jgi:hypothetical protein
LRKLYFDTVVFTHHQLEYLAELYGSDHLLLGTDYPYDMALPDAVNFVTSAKLTQAEKTAILGLIAPRRRFGRSTLGCGAWLVTPRCRRSSDHGGGKA